MIVGEVALAVPVADASAAAPSSGKSLVGDWSQAGKVGVHGIVKIQSARSVAGYPGYAIAAGWGYLGTMRPPLVLQIDTTDKLSSDAAAIAEVIDSAGVTFTGTVLSPACKQGGPGVWSHLRQGPGGLGTRSGVGCRVVAVREGRAAAAPLTDVLTFRDPSPGGCGARLTRESNWLTREVVGLCFGTVSAPRLRSCPWRHGPIPPT